MSINFARNGISAPTPKNESESRRPIVRILDGDSSISSPLRNALERSGFTVTVFEHAFAMANCLTNDAPCCLMIDARQLPKSSDAPDLEAHFGMPIIALVTERTDLRVVVELMKRSAYYVLQKPFEQMSLVVDIATEAVAYGAERQKVLARKKYVGDTLSSLPAGERDVLGYVIDGYANKQIARQLGIALRTVEARRARIMRRLSVNSLAELVRSVTDQAATMAEPSSSRLPQGSSIHGRPVDSDVKKVSERTEPRELIARAHAAYANFQEVVAVSRRLIAHTRQSMSGG